jgi:hypothetical protein
MSTEHTATVRHYTSPAGTAYVEILCATCDYKGDVAANTDAPMRSMYDTERLPRFGMTDAEIVEHLTVPGSFWQSHLNVAEIQERNDRQRAWNLTQS